jgi:glycine dehydrogenase subunit 2
MSTIFEKSHPGAVGVCLPICDVPEIPIRDLLSSSLLRTEPPMLPEVSEPEAVRHFTALSRKNYGVDTGFYPLGSCTMKYNPKVNEDMVRLPGFAGLHPMQEARDTQGTLALMVNLERMLCAITGMDRFTLQPAAGAHGELTGMMLMRAYHQSRGETQRNKVLVPDSAHGTNPASAALAGYEVISVPSDERGNIDINALQTHLDEHTAGLMLTNPNTLGLFDEHTGQLAFLVHAAGGLLYYDGANLNAIMGITRPADMGFDIMHINLHKTFSTPHGGGGPGAGPVGVTAALAPFLPGPLPVKKGNTYGWEMPAQSIGRVHGFHGNIGVAIRAYAYIRSMGAAGLRRVSETAVLNANYIMHRLKGTYHLPYDRPCMHECVLSAQRQKELGASAMDIAKGLLDYGFHPPTVYFPLIVKEAMMIEPTETESKQTLDAFIEAMLELAEKAETGPEWLHNAPRTTPVGRADEVAAARNPVLRYSVQR